MKQYDNTTFSPDGVAALLDSAEVAIWEVDLAARTLVCSPVFTRLTGVESGASVPDFRDRGVSPEDLLHDAIEECVEIGKKLMKWTELNETVGIGKEEEEEENVKRTSLCLEGTFS